MSAAEMAASTVPVPALDLARHAAGLPTQAPADELERARIDLMAVFDAMNTGNNAVGLLRQTIEDLNAANKRLALLEAENARLRAMSDEAPAPDLAIEAARVLTMYPAHGTLSTLAEACERAAKEESHKPCAGEAWEDAATLMHRAADAVYGAEVESEGFKLGDALELLARGPR